MYRNHASVSKGNTPREYLMIRETPESGNEETSSRTTPLKETPASTSSNFPVNQFGEGKDMLKDFVHDALTEIGSDSTMDELLLHSPFDDDQPTKALVLNMTHVLNQLQNEES